jgi:flagellar basal body-associated protein FliL
MGQAKVQIYSNLDRLYQITYHEYMLETKSSFGMPRGKTIWIVGAILLALAVVAGYFFWQYMGLRNNPQAANQNTVARVIDEIKKIYALPTNEDPHVAKINDASKVKSQDFYTNAQTGDYVLIYTKANLAVLYREQDHKLINVDHVTVGPDSGAPTAQK